eukprot:9286505-Ditylum_brightwellii.AAC.1
MMENIIKIKIDDPIDFAAKHDPDINDYIERGHWEIIPSEKFPKGTKILYSVWVMKYKRGIKTRK